jgi:predicted PurR-regulated permease PerM
MAVTAGTIVGGIFGAFVAVPLVAILNNVANDVHGPDLGESPQGASEVGPRPTAPG